MTLLCGEPGCSDLAVRELTGVMRLADARDDVVVDCSKAKQNIKPSNKRSNLSLESATLCSIEGQKPWRRVPADLWLRSDAR